MLAHVRKKGTYAHSVVTLSCIRQSGGFLRHAGYRILKARHLSWKWSYVVVARRSRVYSTRQSSQFAAGRTKTTRDARHESDDFRTFDISLIPLSFFRFRNVTSERT